MTGNGEDEGDGEGYGEGDGVTAGGIRDGEGVGQAPMKVLEVVRLMDGVEGVEGVGGIAAGGFVIAVKLGNLTLFGDDSGSSASTHNVSIGDCFSVPFPT